MKVPHIRLETQCLTHSAHDCSSGLGVYFHLSGRNLGVFTPSADNLICRLEIRFLIRSSFLKEVFHASRSSFSPRTLRVLRDEISLPYNQCFKGGQSGSGSLAGQTSGLFCSFLTLVGLLLNKKGHQPSQTPQPLSRAPYK